MVYFNVVPNEVSPKLCLTVLPWGKYHHEQLPMDVIEATDIPVCASIDDTTTITNPYIYEDHLKTM
jgi:hypothetical protein